MRHYEIVFLVHPDQSEQVPAMIERYSEMVTSANGRMHRTEDWGRRRLAYMINDVHKAHYVLMNIECDLGVLKDIERNFKFNDSILRHLVVRRKEAISEESSIAKQKAKDDAEELEMDKPILESIEHDLDDEFEHVEELDNVEELDQPEKERPVEVGMNRLFNSSIVLKGSRLLRCSIGFSVSKVSLNSIASTPLSSLRCASFPG